MTKFDEIHAAYEAHKAAEEAWMGITQDRGSQILKLLFGSSTYVEDIAFTRTDCGDYLDIEYSYYRGSERDTDTIRIDAAWLFLSDEELAVAARRLLVDMKASAEREEERERQRYAARKEAEEKQQYEALKAKFGGAK